MKTIIGLYDHYSQAEMAVRDMEEYGYDNSRIGMATRDNVMIERKRSLDGKEVESGAPAGGLAGILAGPSALVIAGIGPIIATGTIAETLGAALGITAIGAGVGAAAGSLIGALLDLGFSREDASLYAEGVKRGGVLISVDTETAHAGNVRNILKKAGAVDLDTRRQTWRDEGWTKFVETESSNEDLYYRY